MCFVQEYLLMWRKVRQLRPLDRVLHRRVEPPALEEDVQEAFGLARVAQPHAGHYIDNRRCRGVASSHQKRRLVLLLRLRGFGPHELPGLCVLLGRVGRVGRVLGGRFVSLNCMSCTSPTLSFTSNSTPPMLRTAGWVRGTPRS